MTKATTPHAGNPLRATVLDAALVGEAFTVQIDGADSGNTVNGLAGYTPTPGDRVLVQRVGQQMECALLIDTASGADGLTIVAANFQTVAGVGLGIQGMEMSSDLSGGVIKFFTGAINESGPGYVNPGIISTPNGTSLGFIPVALGGVDIASPDVGGGHIRSHLILWPGYGYLQVPEFLQIDCPTVEFTGDVNGDGKGLFNGNVVGGLVFTNDTTTSTNTVNGVILGTGRILPHSSQRENKLDTVDLTSETARHHIDSLTPTTWIDRLEHEGDDNHEGRPKDEIHRTGGFIVEETDDALITDHGLSPDIDLQLVIASLVKRVQDLTTEVEQLKAA